MSRQPDKLKLGKGAAFVKTRLKRLRQEDETWEADFQALPHPLTQGETHYLGLVVKKEEGLVLAETQFQGRPTANDIATLLANAMRRPTADEAHRPTCLYVRGHRQWQELFPHLEEIGIKVSVRQFLPKVKAAYEDHRRQLREARRARMVRPTAEQASVEKLFPAIAQWVRDGYIQIGDEEGIGFVTQAIDYGGLVFEDDNPGTLAEAMAALEQGLQKWFKEQGIEAD